MSRDGGLRQKYIVLHADTGEPLDGKVFVLRYDRDPHAMNALKAYANSIMSENGQLSDELWDEIMATIKANLLPKEK